MIHNHIDDQLVDARSTYRDWIHNIDQYMQTNYQGSISRSTIQLRLEKLVDGWFVQEMPDLNQDEPLLLTSNHKHTVVD